MCLEWIHLYAVRGGGTVSCKLNYHVVREDWPAVFKDHNHKREDYGLTAGNGESGWSLLGMVTRDAVGMRGDEEMKKYYNK